MKFRSVFVAVTALVLTGSGQVKAQISEGGTPASFSKSLRLDIETIRMPFVDVEAFLAEDEIEQTKGIPYRFGAPFEVSYDLRNSGTWDELPGGDRIWRFRIEADGAYSINLVYDDFYLPEGAKFYIYNEDRSMVVGAFTARNNKDHGEFATELVQGDVSILEYYEPAAVRGEGVISIIRIVHAYRNLFSWDFTKQFLDYGSSGACNNNVVCPEGDDWRENIRSVAMTVTSGGFRFCTGSLVNNVRQDMTPYFLTANHCLGGEATWVFMFNYESPTCSNVDGPTWMTVQGSTLKASASFSDFGLLLLNEPPPDSFNVYYSGWSAVDTAADSCVAIHHPSGDIKKISFNYDDLTATSYLGTSIPGDNSHWRIDDWEDGTTEPGSSGSPIYDFDHRLLGQLHGGYASCASITSDWYGKFSVSWDNGSSASSRLKDWLDPDNTGTLLLDGRDGAGISITHTPLPDTRDSLNDYEVIATITSDVNLVADSLLLYYQLSSVWYEETLLATGGTDEFNAFIPAQSPGTEISYYLFASDEEGKADTTDILTFRVIDYGMELVPLYSEKTVAAYDTAWHSFDVTNIGLYDDSYDLSLAGDSWYSTIWDETGTTQITSTGLMYADETVTFLVLVEVPASVYGDYDSATVEVTSAGDPTVSMAAGLKTISAGEPYSIPFVDSFATTTIDIGKWVVIEDVEANENALNPPSSPYSLNLNGSPDGSDMISSQAINLKNESNIIFSYYYEQTGGGDSPEAGDDLIVEYLDTLGSWQQISIHEGADGDMTDFAKVDVLLPGDAYHSNFRIRFRNTATSGLFDDWFVDDISVDFAPAITASPASYSVTLDQDDSTTAELVISNSGPGNLSYNISIQPQSEAAQLFLRLVAEGRTEPASRLYPEGFLAYDDPKGADDPRVGTPVEKNAGGPDAFGYFWIDSDEAGGPVYSWIDVSGSGTDIVGDLADDNYGGPYSIGMDFLFYGSTYNQIYIGSNGIIGFGAINMSSRFKTSIPNTGTPNNMIAWLWDDLNPVDGSNPGAHVYVDADGSRCVIQFVDYPEYSASVGDVVNAEVILYSDGRIVLQYQTIAAGFDIANSAIGIENADGTDGLEVAFLTSYLHDNLAIQFHTPFQWLSLNQSSGGLATGEADTITCNFNSTGLDTGVYISNVIVSSNDPDPEDNPWIISAQLTVEETVAFICGDVDGNGEGPLVDDLTYLVAHLFTGGPPPPVPDAADLDASGEINVIDLTILVAYLFTGGPPPVCP